MNSVFSLEDSKNIEDTNIFVDTNILIYVDGIYDYNDKTAKYSDAYFNLKNKNELHTNEYVIGEFCNRVFKYNIDLCKVEDPKIPHLKQFRKTETGKEILSNICDSVFHFLEDMQLLSVGEKFPRVETILEDFKTGKIDFTDSVISNICGESQFYMLTDDGDIFCKKDVTLITDNIWVLENSKNRNNFAI